MLQENNFLEYISSVTPQWLAGFFDGEGCVSCSLDIHGNVKLRVELSQKNKYVLYLVMLKFPGTFKVDRQNNTHRLHYDGRNCIAILEYIKDHLIFKRQIVLTGLKLASLIQENNYKLSKEVFNTRALLKDEIDLINETNRQSKVI